MDSEIKNEGDYTNNKKKMEKHQVKQFNYYRQSIQLSAIGILVLFNVFFNMFFVDRRFLFISSVCTLLIPLIMFLISISHQKENDKNNYQTELNTLKEEIASEMNISDTVPTLLFGLSLMFTNYTKSDYMTTTIPYLLLSVMFGSLFPQLFKHLVIDHSNLLRLFIIGEISYTFVSISFGLLVACFVLPIYMYANNMKK
jgi:L-asparagine transporter-like permease